MRERYIITLQLSTAAPASGALRRAGQQRGRPKRNAKPARAIPTGAYARLGPGVDVNASNENPEDSGSGA